MSRRTPSAPHDIEIRVLGLQGRVRIERTGRFKVRRVKPATNERT